MPFVLLGEEDKNRDGKTKKPFRNTISHPSLPALGPSKALAHTYPDFAVLATELYSDGHVRINSESVGVGSFFI